WITLVGIIVIVVRKGVIGVHLEVLAEALVSAQRDATIEGVGAAAGDHGLSQGGREWSATVRPVVVQEVRQVDAFVPGEIGICHPVRSYLLFIAKVGAVDARVLV